jgi:hypothetical protein
MEEETSISTLDDVSLAQHARAIPLETHIRTVYLSMRDLGMHVAGTLHISLISFSKKRRQ